MTYDAHPDDPEFERLLALLLSEARVPVGETDEQHDDRMGRYHEIERQLLALDQPVSGADSDPPSTDIDADPLTTPGDLLAPRSPWLRDVGSTRITREGFIETQSVLVPDAEAVRRAALTVTDKKSDSKLLAGRLIAHHVLYDLQPPDEVMQALAVALGLNGKRVKTPARDAAEAAYESIGREQTPEAFRAVVTSLGLTDDHGALRQQVIEKLRPGQRYGVRGDSRDEYRIAVEAEVAARVDAGDWGTPALPQLEIADRLGWTKNGKGHIGVIRHWTPSEQWKMDTMSLAYWQAKRMRAAIDIEARAVVQRVDPPGNATLAALIGGEARVVNWWRNRPDWLQRVRKRVDVMEAAAKRSRAHEEEIHARQVISRESN